jgi:hypothetical protein
MQRVQRILFVAAKGNSMATRQQRLEAFITEGGPTADRPFELLCEDHIGTYVLPYDCHWTQGAWRNIETGGPIEAEVIGWRARGE